MPSPAAPEARIGSVIFDIGKVLLEWDPRHLYRGLIPEEAAMERFLAEVCTPAWNLEQDRGRAWSDAVAELSARHPDQAHLIRAFREGWHDMVPGLVPGTLDLLEALRARGVPLYAITNFAADTWEECIPRFPFLGEFRDVVVSGRERVVKPDAAIFRLLLDRNGLDAARCLFIDDSLANVQGARAVGMRAHHFLDASGLEAELRGLGLLG